ncbi:MAG: CHASE2 domain-containing protein [Cyanobacteria bacterium P01_F01_bin.150]
MVKVVTLRLDGRLDRGGIQATVEVRVGDRSPAARLMGQLPSAPELAHQLAQWEKDYWTWGVPHRIRPKAVTFTGTGHQTEVCRQSAQALEKSFLQWLSSAEFLKLDMQLRPQVQPNEATLVMLQTQSDVLRKLPWHLWEFVERYAQAELVLSATTFQKAPAVPRASTHGVKILAILGNATGIDIESDRSTLQSLPNAEVTFLVEPEREALNDRLWDQAWDILFFAGHSQTEDGRGRIYINREDSLTLQELKFGLRQAIQKGLKLAIFNSCDGLGLAYELEQLSLPHLIIMREPVPDKVAHRFLTYFLPSFAQGKSLYKAFREARERLQGMENTFPCASWLPIIYQQPSQIGLTWQSFTPSTSEQLPQQSSAALPLESNLDPPSPPSELSMVASPPDIASKRPSQPALSMLERGVVVAIATIIVTSLIVGLRSLGFFQSSELKAYDHFMQLRAKPFPDERLLVVTVDKADIDYQDEHDYQRREGWSLSDQALAEALQTVGKYQPRTVGLDIAHPYPFESSVMSALEQYNINMVAACVVGTSDTLSDDAKPPNGFEGDTLGFADIPIDLDGVVRRQLPLMAAGDPCKTSRSLALQLTHQYLTNEKVDSLQKLPNGDRQIGTQRLQRLQHDTGGYQLAVDATYGYQLLLNYRYADPVTISLREILASQSESRKDFSDMVTNRIVLIGADQSQQDRHRTSIHNDIPGVILHAHMSSHLLDIALANKAQLWWWSQWVESAWIALWAIIASGVVLLVRLPWKLGLSLFSIIMLLYVICWIAFIGNGWIPLVPTATGIFLTFSIVAITIKSNVLSRQR